MKITIDFKDPKIEKPNPKNDFDEFLIVSKSGCILKTNYSIRYGLFNAHDYTSRRKAMETAIYPRLWAEIPPELLAQEDDDEQTE